MSISNDLTLTSPSSSSSSSSNARMPPPSSRPAKQRQPASVSTSNNKSASFNSPKHVDFREQDQEPSFTFVCLGVGGGPLEGDCSCYLLKPAHRSWTEGCVVLEGGSWLGALTRVLEDSTSASAFADTEFPFDIPALKAGFIGSFAHSFLISHAHLDHILGMVLGSASLPGKRKVFGLKGTLDNLMDVFNGKIWPRLATFEDDGPAVYKLSPLEPQLKAQIDEDLSVLPFALSHGLNPSIVPAPPTPTPMYHRLSLSGKRLSLPSNGYFSTPIYASTGSSFGGSSSPFSEKPIFTSPFAPDEAINEKLSKVAFADEEASPETDTNTFAIENAVSPTSKVKIQSPQQTPTRTGFRSNAGGISGSLRSAKSKRPKTAAGTEGLFSSNSERSMSVAAGANFSDRRNIPTPQMTIEKSFPALDSTAFFVTNERTGRDVLFFGDVEPDSVSQSPRNGKIWAHAGQRFADKKLNTIFLECSFPASHPTEYLYGHLSVRFLFDEMNTLARSVVAERKRNSAKKERTNHRSTTQSSEGASKRILASQLPAIPALHTSERTITDEELRNSLSGLHVVIIHVKTALFPSYETTTRLSASSSASFRTAEGSSLKDERLDEETLAKRAAAEMINLGRTVDLRTMQSRILQELEEHEETHKLGVRFTMAQQGLRIDC